MNTDTRADVPDRLIAAGLVIGIAGVPLAVSPAGYNPFGPVKLAALGVAAVLVALGCAAGDGSRRLSMLVKSPIAWAWLALGGLTTLSTLLAEDRRAATLASYPGYEAGLLPLCAAVIVGLGAAALVRTRSHRLLGRSLAVSLGLVGAYAILQRLGLDPLTASEYLDVDRARSTLGNASNLGLWCAIAAPWALESARVDTSVAWRRARLAAGVFAVGAVGVSGSRGAFAALGVGALVWLGLGGGEVHGDRRRARALLAVVAVPLVVVAVLAVGTLVRTEGPDTTRGRLLVWRTSTELVAERPFLGWGLDGFGRGFERIAPPELADPAGRDRALTDPHNLLVSTAVSSGVAAALVLLALVTMVVRFGVRVRAPMAALVSLAAAFVGLQVHFLTPDTTPLVCVGLALVAMSDAEERDAASAKVKDTRTIGVVRLVALGGAALAVVVAASGIALVLADLDVGAAFDGAATRAGWSGASARLTAARKIAGFDPFPFRATARVVTVLGAASADEAVLSEALTALDRADVLRPGDARIARERGDVLAVAGMGVAEPKRTRRLEMATEAYSLALERAPTEPLAWLGRGSSKLASGDTRGAIDDLERATELAPRLEVAWTNLASAYELAGDPARAADARRRSASAQ